MFPNLSAKEGGFKEKGRDKQWDDRFGNKAVIPPYSPLKDKHTKSYRKIIGHNLSKVEHAQLRKKTYYQKRVDLLEEIKQMNPLENQAIVDLEDTFTRLKVPNFYVYYSLQPLLLEPDLRAKILHQKKNLREGNSHYHKINTAINAREECLDKLHSLLTGSKEKLMAYRSTLKEQITNLRRLTTNVIDEIKRWRDSLTNIEERAIYYSEQQENYLLKMLNDNHFIFSSYLANQVHFGEKNDPFILIPLKRFDGSALMEVLRSQKDLSYYQKYMDYLANQKAYDMKVSKGSFHKSVYRDAEDKTQRGHIIQKNKKFHAQTQQQPANIDEEEKEIERNRLREQRLQKNKERINSIRSIYETYSKRQRNDLGVRSEKKIAETDGDERQRKFYAQKKLKNLGDNQFETMVRMKLDSQKIKTPMRRTKKAQSQKRLQKSEDRMIESLRDIQSTLKSKIKHVRGEEKAEGSYEADQKNQSEALHEMRRQIIHKLERENDEKEKQKKRKKESEEKVVDEVRNKLKWDVIAKLDEKKREKLLQREQLERRLRQQEQRLSKQRSIEMQLQMKLGNERQLRTLKKVRREALQTQKKLKMELQQEKKARKERQEEIMKERRIKEQLLEELRKKEIRREVEEQLKAELKSKQKIRRQVTQADIDELRQKKSAQLMRQIEALKVRERSQMDQLEKQNELRERMLNLKREQQELKQKEIQQMTRKALLHGKQQMQREGTQISFQEAMRNNGQEREPQASKHRVEKDTRLDETAYRLKIKQKLEKEMRMDAISKTREQLEQRESRRTEIQTSSLGQSKLDMDRDASFNMEVAQSNSKKDMLNKSISEQRGDREAAKSSLRSQFERELFSSSIPQIYEPKDPYLLKDISHLEDEHYLNKKIAQRPVNMKRQEHNQLGTQSVMKEQKPALNNQELYIYSKKKSKIKESREEPIHQLPKKLPEEGYELIKVQPKEHDTYNVKVIRKPKHQLVEEQHFPKKKAKKKKRQVESEDESEEYSKRIRKDSEDSEDKEAEKKKRKSTMKQRTVNSDSEGDQSLEEPKKHHAKQHRKKGKQGIKSSMSKKKDFRTSEEQADQPERMQQEEPNYNQIEPITKGKIWQSGSKFGIQLQAILQNELDEYLAGHFNKLPISQLNILQYNREQLYRKLVGQLTFCLLLGYYQQQVIGIALAYHDRNKAQIRKFNIIHISTYRDQNLQDFILSVSNFIFHKDPSDEIQFLYKFNQYKEQELNFSTTFNKWFDHYGNIYQKKTDQNQYERKYVLKRKFNQKCQVVLAGINKNYFRNIFNVYLSVVMSDNDMLQFKEQLTDTLSPELNISYAVLAAELFRNCLTPEEADILKGKVKEFVKLKELLILVVMLQKKKVKIQQLKITQHKTLVELNMKLMSQGKDVIRYIKDNAISTNRLYHCELSHGFNLPFQFQTTSLPIESKGGYIHHVSYFRLSPLPPNKLHLIKSSLYNTQMSLLPTQHSKYKIFVMDAQEYIQLKEDTHLDLFMYLRLFLKNVKSHNVSGWKYVWLPEMTDKGAWNIREFHSFLKKDIYVHDFLNISYRQFLPGALIIEPEHRDLMVTPPFIVGIMSMVLEQITQGSPLYARLVGMEALKTIEIEHD